jgi:hypothetical protein
MAKERKDRESDQGDHAHLITPRVSARNLHEKAHWEGSALAVV